MFNNATPEDLKINKKAFVKVYYEYDPNRNKPFRLFEREWLFDSWRIVDDYKTLAEAQESGRSRAIKVVDMGLFERGHRKGMMSWWDEPKAEPKVFEMAILPPSTEVEYDSRLRKVPKPSSKPASKRSSLIDEDDMLDIEDAEAQIVGARLLDMEEEESLKRNIRTEFRK